MLLRLHLFQKPNEYKTYITNITPTVKEPFATGVMY